MTVHRLQELNKKTSLNLIFLMEIKNPDAFVLTKLQSLGFWESKLVYPHSPRGGGLALLWNQYIELEILSANSNFIDTSVKAEGKQFFVTFVYEEPNKTKKKAIWDQLTIIGQFRAEVWLLTADFNDIINSRKTRRTRQTWGLLHWSENFHVYMWSLWSPTFGELLILEGTEIWPSSSLPTW